MIGKRCMVCDGKANHFDCGFSYCGLHSREDLKRQFEQWKKEEEGRCQFCFFERMEYGLCTRCDGRDAIEVARENMAVQEQAKALGTICTDNG